MNRHVEDQEVELALNNERYTAEDRTMIKRLLSIRKNGRVEIQAEINRLLFNIVHPTRSISTNILLETLK